VETRGEFYLRKSRALGDAEDPGLLATHRALLFALAEADGVAVDPAAVHEEIGSAEEIEARPVFRQLLARWERLPRGTGGVLYVVDLIRLTRGSGADWARIHAALAAAGIKVRTRTRLFDPRDPDDTTWMEFEAFFGRVELRYMKARAALARAKMVRDGQVLTGRVPFGYRWDAKKKQPEPDPVTFPLLREACRQALTRSVERIGQELGVSQGRLLTALRNPLICGWPAQRYQARPPDREPRARDYYMPRDQWRWADEPGTYPAACSRPEWEAIQDALAARLRGREKTGKEGWCRDVLRFDGAAGRVRLGAQHTALTYDLIRKGEPRLYVFREAVHRAALETLTALFRGDCGADLLRMAHRSLELREAAAVAPERQQEALRRELDRERQKLAGLAEARYDPDPEEARAAATAYAAVRTRIRHVMAALAMTAERRPQPELAALLPVLTDLRDNFAGIWDLLLVDERRMVTRTLIDSILVRVVPGRGSWPGVRQVLAVNLAPWIRGE
jgi:hypothetical protein